MNTDDLPSLEELAALLPQYRFENLIASGGMGAVYRAEQISLGRHVAIKILPRSLSADETYREQFKSEARLMGSLTYPHIVDIHDFGVAGEVLYIVMELLEGTNLYERMRGEPLRLSEVVKVFSQVCDALTAAHHKGVVHRDVKPENIFIESGLRVKLGDFGISRQRRTDMAGEAPQAAISGVRLGTPEYAAPELFDFQKHIDHRADIFSLGVVLYEVLTGARPTGVFIAPSKRKPGVDRRFDEVVMRAMQYEPEDRYKSTEEMKKDLLRLLSPAAQPVAVRTPTGGRTPTGQKGARPSPAAAPKAAAPPARLPDKTAAPKKRKPVLLWGGIGGAAAAAILVMVFKGGGSPAEKKGRGEAPDSARQLERIFGDDGKKPAAVTPAVASTPTPAPPPLREPGPPAEKLAFGGHTYQFIPSRLSWTEAKAAAEKQGGHLACVTSQAEYDALRAYLLPLLKVNNDGCWLGASDAETEGAWKWITGEPFEFKAWAPGAPNNGSGTSQGEQDFLVWQKQNKYGERGIEWNDVTLRLPATAIAGSLVEWDQAAAAPPPVVVTQTPPKTTPEPKPPTPPAPAPVTAPAATAGGWQPVVWTDADLEKVKDKVIQKDGWYVSTAPVSLNVPAPAAFTNGAFRLRLRVESGSRVVQIKPHFLKEDSLQCALEMPGSIKVARRDAGAQVQLADWPLASPLQPGDEVRMELRLLGAKLTVLFNGTVAGAMDTGDSGPEKLVRIFSNGFSFRDAEWLPLDGVAEPDKALVSPPAWPVNAELAALSSWFTDKREATYGGKLKSALKPLRDSYAARLRQLAAQKPAEAAVYNAESTLITGGGDPPPADAAGTPPPLAPLRKTWHDAKAAQEKPFAAAALALWREHLAKLAELESTLRQAHKFADLPDIIALRGEAEAAVAHFTSFVPAKPGQPDTSPPVATGVFPLKRPAATGRVVAWRRHAEVTHDMGAAEIPPDLGPVVALAAGPEYALALRPDGTVVQWGTAFAKHIEPPAGLTDVVAIDAGGKFAAALRSDGSVVAWGFDWRGRLVPSGLKPAVALSCGELHGHMLHADGTVSYFGYPDGGRPAIWSPTAAFTVIKALDGGNEVMMGLKADGSISFLGSNLQKQITGLPAKVKKASLIACGVGVACALSGDMLYFWGKATEAKDAEYGHGSFKFPAVQVNAAPFANTIAARNSSGEWKFFGHAESTDLHEAAKRAKGALDVRFSNEHILALMPDAKK